MWKLNRAAAALSLMVLGAVAATERASASRNAASLIEEQAQPAESSERPALLHSLRALTQNVTGSCDLQFTPDQARVEGGLTADGVMAEKVDRQIDERLDELEQIVGDFRGRLARRERVRSVRNPDDDARVAEQAPFVAVQRVVIELPVDVEIDRAIDRFVLAGMDRFGSDLRGEAKGPQAAVVYVRREIEPMLNDLHQQCRRQVLDSWCEVSVPASVVSGCQELLRSLEPHFETGSLQLQSESVLLVSGRTSRLNATWPYRANQWAQFELVDRSPVQLIGTMTLRIRNP